MRECPDSHYEKSPVSQQERRREPRFGMRTAVTVEIGPHGQELSATTQNLSAHGLLLHAESLIPEIQKLKVIIELKLTPRARSVRLIYEGKIVRREQESMAGTFAVAVVCDHPASLSVIS